MAQTPPTLQVDPVESKDPEQVRRTLNELIRRLDEIHRLRNAEVADIEQRLDDGGL